MKIISETLIDVGKIGFGMSSKIKITIQPIKNQLKDIDFDVTDKFNYILMKKEKEYSRTYNLNKLAN